METQNSNVTSATATATATEATETEATKAKANGKAKATIQRTTPSLVMQAIQAVESLTYDATNPHVTPDDYMLAASVKGKSAQAAAIYDHCIANRYQVLLGWLNDTNPSADLIDFVKSKVQKLGSRYADSLITIELDAGVWVCVDRTDNEIAAYKKSELVKSLRVTYPLIKSDWSQPHLDVLSQAIEYQQKYQAVIKANNLAQVQDAAYSTQNEAKSALDVLKAQVSKINTENTELAKLQKSFETVKSNLDQAKVNQMQENLWAGVQAVPYSTRDEAEQASAFGALIVRGIALDVKLADKYKNVVDTSIKLTAACDLADQCTKLKLTDGRGALLPLSAAQATKSETPNPVLNYSKTILGGETETLRAEIVASILDVLEGIELDNGETSANVSLACRVALAQVTQIVHSKADGLADQAAKLTKMFTGKVTVKTYETLLAAELVKKLDKVG